MNKTEAKQILEQWLSESKGTEKKLGYINGWFYEEDEEAFRMAIEALQTDVVKCEECIRRGDVDDYLGRFWCPMHRGYMPKEYFCADGLRGE